MPDIDITKTEEPQKNKINLDDWIKKFKASEKIMKAQFKHKWQVARQRIRAEYDVKHRNSKKMTHQNVPLAYSIGQSFVSSVYFKAPNCSLTAREETNHDTVENTEVKVNDWLADNKVKKVVRRNIWDSYASGIGARFIDYEYDDREDQNNVIDPGSPEIPEQLDPSGVIIPAQSAVAPTFGRTVLKNEITIQRIRPDLVRFPKGFDFDNYQDSPWIGFDIITPIDEVKNSKDWDQSVASEIEGEKYDKLSDTDKTSTQDDDDTLYAKISYVFQKPASPLEPFKLLVFCHKYNAAPLLFEDFDKGHVGYPIKFIYFNPLDDDCSYPNGDVWNFESMLQAVDTWWRKMCGHVEKSNPKRIYDSGSVSKQEVQNLKSNNDLEWVGVENKERRNLSEVVQTFEAAAVHPDVSRFYEVARQLLSEVSPRSGMSRGAEDQKVDTATEAKIINTGEIIDIEARIDVVRDYIIDIVLDVAGILEKSLQSTIPVKREFPDEMGKPVEQITQVGADGFTSKINVDVDVESMQAQNKDVFRRQLLDALKFLVSFEPVMNKPSIDPETGIVRPGKTLDPLFWLERIMETMNIRNVEKGIVDLPPMMMAPQEAGMPPGPQESIESDQGIDTREDTFAARP